VAINEGLLKHLISPLTNSGLGLELPSKVFGGAVVRHFALLGVHAPA
jgi:hypothetical protein